MRKTYIVTEPFPLFGFYGQVLHQFRTGNTIYVTAFKNHRALVEVPKKGWIKKKHLTERARLGKRKELAVSKDLLVIVEEVSELILRLHNVEKRSSKLIKPKQLLKGQYYKSSKAVELFCSRGRKIGELFPNSTMRVLNPPKNGLVTISWPVNEVEVKASALESRVKAKERLGNYANHEDMVKHLNGYFCDRFASEKLIYFVQRFLRVECEHNTVYDLSYNERSQFSRLCQHPGVDDFRDFHVTQRCGIFINLPWFYKKSLAPCVRRLLKEADEKGVIVDILVVQAAHSQKKLKFSKLASKQWIIRDQFLNPKTGKKEHIGDGKILLAYFTNFSTRAKVMRRNAENLQEFKALKCKK